MRGRGSRQPALLTFLHPGDKPGGHGPRILLPSPPSIPGGRAPRSPGPWRPAMKKLPLATMATLIAGAAGFVLLTGFAGGGCGHHHPRDPAEVAAAVTARVDDALDDLDATAAQRQQINAVKDRM